MEPVIGCLFALFNCGGVNELADLDEQFCAPELAETIRKKVHIKMILT